MTKAGEAALVPQRQARAVELYKTAFKLFPGAPDEGEGGQRDHEARGRRKKHAGEAVDRILARRRRHRGRGMVVVHSSASAEHHRCRHPWRQAAGLAR